MEPTKQQESILNYYGNTVIIAAPGSGKTFVISEKIKTILSNLNYFEGVIAISYTNKASNELKNRSLLNGINPKGSFFGTIDRFFISEIIIPFGKQLFGLPEKQIEIVKINILDKEEIDELKWVSRELVEEDIEKDNLECLKKYFLKGILLMETLGVLGNYIFTHSEACRKYMRAKYKFIFIDEYQDSGINQHNLFLRITQLGLIGIAVGDINQSIYKFSGKDSRFLSELSSRADFKLFYLNKNHRCHASIINYSNYLLNPNTELIESETSCVFHVRTEGSESSVSAWIDKHIKQIKTLFKTESNSKIAILTRSQRTAELVSQSLTTPYRLSLTTDLDGSLNIWSAIFANLLYFVFDRNFRFIEVIETFSSYDNFSKLEIKKLVTLKNQISTLFKVEKDLDNKAIIQRFCDIAKIIAPNSPKGDSIEQLKNVLSNNLLLNSYHPAKETEIHIMTLHKSKGLEFDIVFHLDLHEWVLPLKQPGQNQDWNNPTYQDWIQDINLHYVGITRARKACFLISSTERTNSSGVIKKGKDSEFLWLNEISSLRYVKQY